MKGHIRRRGERSFELKFDAGRDPATGKRIIQYQSFKGTKREAQIKLASLISSVDQGSFIEPTKITVAEFVRLRVTAWEAAGAITAKTAQRYRELIENQIVPHLGATVVQKLRPLHVEAWHAALRNIGLAPRTIGHAHRVLSKALKDAVGDDMLVKNVATAKPAPKVADNEMVICRDVPGLVEKLKSNARLHVPGMVALFSGMRLGEILALRWGRVDLDKNVIEVREAVEHTTAFGLRFQTAKEQGGSPEHYIAGFVGRDVARLSQGATRIARAVGRWEATGRRLAVCQCRGHPALAQFYLGGMERLCGSHRDAGGEFSRIAAYAR